MRKAKSLFSLLAGSCFLISASWAAAQFPPLKKKPAEKPAETKSEAKASTSSAPMTVNWTDNAMTFEVPGGWQELMKTPDMANYMLMPATDSAALTITISRMNKDFPADKSMKANRDDAPKKKQRGEIVSFEDVLLGKVNGLMYIEAAKASADDVRRMTWIGFQKKNGWNQVTIHLSSKSGAFATHEATFRKVLSTVKIDTE